MSTTVGVRADVKLGQLLRTRFDLLPAACTEALARLQDTVEPFDAGEARAIVEAEVGASVRSLCGSR